LVPAVCRADVAATVDGDTLTGTVAAATDAAILWRSEAGQERKLSVEDLVRIDLEGAAGPAGAALPLVILANGDRIAARIEGGGERDLRLASAPLGAVALPIKSVAAILFDRDATDSAVAQLSRNEAGQDELLLRNGECLAGVVKSVEADRLTFDCLLGVVPILFSRAAGVSFARAAAPAAGEGPTAIAEFADGSRITGRLKVSEKAEMIALTSSWGQELSVRFRGAVSAIEFRGGRLVYLSDLEPAEVEEVPYLGRAWHWRRDRAVGGEPISLRGKVYRKGLGVHSRARLAYRLDGQFERFRALAGIDDETKGLGEAAFRVLADGKPVFAREKVKGTQPAVAIEVPLRGVVKLELIADFGGELDVAGHADWADARLERARQGK
jgi:hypothetical protein